MPSDTPESVRVVLRRRLENAAEHLRAAGLPQATIAALEALAGQTEQRCVVAVVGRVKAGKSTFVNALLGGALAAVGERETTATINYFTLGMPADPDRPIRCHWRSGQVTREGREFLDGLQGSDEETLRRAEGIDHLEYVLDHPLLRDVTLVDTPGTNAAVAEHTERLDAFLGSMDRRREELRERHQDETDRLAREADAVIYVTGAVARADQRAFLEEFRRTTGGRSSALNAVGVMTKIEVSDEYLARSDELSRHYAEQLRGELNTVVPVATGIGRALQALCRDDRRGLERVHRTLARIPPDRLRRMLAAEQRFVEREYDDCPVDAPTRRSLLDELTPDVRVWAVFAAIARYIVEHGDESTAELAAGLGELTRLDALRQVLDRHLLARGHILRCHRALLDAKDVIDGARRRLAEDRAAGGRERQRRADRMLAFVRAADGDPTVGEEIAQLIRTSVAAVAEPRAEEACADVARELEELEEVLVAHNADFEALQAIERNRADFTAEELDELQAVLGLRGLSDTDRLPRGVGPEYVSARMLFWKERAARAATRSARRLAADQAFVRYGHLLASFYD
ncbi:dynamin family protein [Actinomycetospora aeridis]|uniref:Dynamin family protein n=1 Tax=Actinomycetospora aeridis TaxID=3129231 RepID=A0ABU8N6F1_9PSEU